MHSGPLNEQSEPLARALETTTALMEPQLVDDQHATRVRLTEGIDTLGPAVVTSKPDGASLHPAP